MKRQEKIYLFDIPSSAGCLELGTEDSPAHFRKVGMVDALRRTELEVIDLGSVLVAKSERHNRPPIRNYPFPKTVWEKTQDFLKKLDLAPKDLLFCIGGDCSIVVGTASAMANRLGSEIHVLYVDGDTDTIMPTHEKCVGSAGMGLWLLTQPSEYWSGKKLKPAQISVLGSKEPQSETLGISTLSLPTLRDKGLARSIKDELAAIPGERRLFLHLDVDVLSQAEMPASYSPRETGLSFSELEELLMPVFVDSRLAFVEITEFVPRKDPSGIYAAKVMGLVSRGFSRRKLALEN